MVAIVNAGADCRHPESFEINRPFGTGMYSIVLFGTRASVEIEGKMVSVEADSMIIYDRYYNQHYRTEEKYLLTDFVNFDLDSNEKVMKLKNIVINKPFRVKNADSVRKIIWLIAFEFKNSYPGRDENITRLFNILLRKTEEETELPLRNKNYENNEKLRQIRGRIIENPQYNWNIEELAREAGMSNSHFQTAYKGIFGINCISDVIAIRLEFAKYLIRNSTSPMKKIAACSGYNSTEHFSRQFKRAYGMTPLEYRNLYRNDKNKTVIFAKDEE